MDYRKALEVRIVLQNLENKPKQDFCTYGENGAFYSIMTTNVGKILEAAMNYLNWKICLLESVCPTTKLSKLLCRMRKYKSNTYAACTKEKKEIRISSQVVEVWNKT